MCSSDLVGGQPVVGVIVFLILVIIQFVVITKGQNRISEVTARFTLDAMPGKQMSIDADLRAGLIDAAEARRRRRLIEKESQFHGAMDGAMKFVKGDAIAGIIISVINLVAGFVIGVMMKGFSLQVAGRSCWGESEESLRKGYEHLFAEHGIPVDAGDPEALVLFPEMDATRDVPEITEACWAELGVHPSTIM